MGVSGRGNHFLVADHPLGPWQLVDGPADVADERYAARILDHDGLQIIGFKDGEPDRFGGYLMDPQTVSIDPERGWFWRTDMAAITLKNIRKSFGDVEVIKGVDIDIGDGEFVVFVGPSGCEIHPSAADCGS